MAKKNETKEALAKPKVSGLTADQRTLLTEGIDVIGHINHQNAHLRSWVERAQVALADDDAVKIGVEVADEDEADETPKA